MPVPFFKLIIFNLKKVYIYSNTKFQRIYVCINVPYYATEQPRASVQFPALPSHSAPVREMVAAVKADRRRGLSTPNLK